MTETPSLPPAYHLLPIPATGDAFSRARRIAAEGAEDGTLVWSRLRNRLDCAVVLAPEAPLRESLLVVYAAMLGLGDGLGALAPPVVAVTFGWPDRLEVNGGTVGGVRVAAAAVERPEASVPSWMVVGVTVAIEADPKAAEPGHDPSRTTLREEGCGEIGAADLLESFGRHFLSWINRWQDDGFGPLRDAWTKRALARGRRVEVALPGVPLSGRFAGIDDAGGLLLIEEGRTLTAHLAEALSVPSWCR